jgi:hypothetical protein
MKVVRSESGCVIYQGIRLPGGILTKENRRLSAWWLEHPCTRMDR